MSYLQGRSVAHLYYLVANAYGRLILAPIIGIRGRRWPTDAARLSPRLNKKPANTVQLRLAVC